MFFFWITLVPSESTCSTFFMNHTLIIAGHSSWNCILKMLSKVLMSKIVKINYLSLNLAKLLATKTFTNYKTQL